jgi:hypothetical protein
MSRDSHWAEEVWTDPELIDVDDDPTEYVRMMTRRGVVREVHPAQVPAKQASGWEVVKT